MSYVPPPSFDVPMPSRCTKCRAAFVGDGCPNCDDGVRRLGWYVTRWGLEEGTRRHKAAGKDAE